MANSEDVVFGVEVPGKTPSVPAIDKTAGPNNGHHSDTREDREQSDDIGIFTGNKVAGCGDTSIRAHPATCEEQPG